MNVLQGDDYFDVSILTLDDNTEIVHSEMRNDGIVKVYLEVNDEKTRLLIRNL